MTHQKDTQEIVRVEGLVEICDLPGFRDTPLEHAALTHAFHNLTQYKSHQVVAGTLFVEFNLGDVSPQMLKSLASYAKHRFEQKALQALKQLKLTRVK